MDRPLASLPALTTANTTFIIEDFLNINDQSVSSPQFAATAFPMNKFRITVFPSGTSGFWPNMMAFMHLWCDVVSDQLPVRVKFALEDGEGKRKNVFESCELYTAGHWTDMWKFGGVYTLSRNFLRENDLIVGGKLIIHCEVDILDTIPNRSEIEAEAYKDLKELLVSGEMDVFKNVCIDQMLNSISVDNVLQYLNVTDMYGSEELKQKCLKFIADNAAEVMQSPAWMDFIKMDRQSVLLEIMAKMAGKTKKNNNELALIEECLFL